MRSQVLVLGGAGFIGSHLCDGLLKRGHGVIAADNLSRGSLANLSGARASERFAFVLMDATDAEAVAEAAAGCDVIVNLAAHKIPRFGGALETLRTNTRTSEAALEAARAHGAKCVLASTSDVYGKSAALPFREDSDCVLGPTHSRRWAYAASKLFGEHLALGYAEEHGLRTVALRYFGTYGERQHLDWWGGPQGLFASAIAAGERLELHGDGEQTRCFIHVDDTVEATIRAIERSAADGLVVNVGTTEEISIAGLARLMHELSGTAEPLRVEYVPYESFSGAYEDVRRRLPDLSRSEELLGFRPKVSLRAGLERFWAWYRGAALEPQTAT